MLLLLFPKFVAFVLYEFISVRVPKNRRNCHLKRNLSESRLNAKQPWRKICKKYGKVDTAKHVICSNFSFVRGQYDLLFPNFGKNSQEIRMDRLVLVVYYFLICLLLQLYEGIICDSCQYWYGKKTGRDCSTFYSLFSEKRDTVFLIESPFD